MAVDQEDFDALMEQERRQMIAARMLPPVGEPIPKDKLDEVRDAAQRFLKEKGLTREDLALGIGKSSSTVSEFLSGTYGGRAEPICRKVNAWLESRSRQIAARRDKPFVWTAVAKAIGDAVRNCNTHGMIGLIYGPAGIGKTRTLEIVAQQLDAIYIFVGADDKGIPGVRAALYQKLTGNQRGKPVREQVGIAQALTRGDKKARRLIIIDQAHKLTDAAIEYLFDLHDRHECPMVLCGTSRLGDRISADRDPRFGQLYSRVGMRANLVKLATARNGGKRLFTEAEVREIFERGKVRLAADSVRYLTDAANTLGHGCLRLCDQLMRWAEARARKRSDGQHVDITLRDLTKAHVFLDDEAPMILADEEPEQRLAATA